MARPEPVPPPRTVLSAAGLPIRLHVARRRRLRPRRRRIALFSSLIATALVALSSSSVAMQDIPALLGRSNIPPARRWLAFLTPMPVGAAYGAMIERPVEGPVVTAPSQIMMEPHLALVEPSIVSAPPFVQPAVNRLDKTDAADARVRPASIARLTAPSWSRRGALDDVLAMAAPTEGLSVLTPRALEKVVVAAVSVTASTARRVHPGKAADDLLVSAYANADDRSAIEAPFAALLAKPMGSLAIGKDGKPDHWWVTNPIPATARASSEQKCLATAIYFEARGEPVKGELAVAQVVINRLKNPVFPKTICGVVYQNQEIRDGCQFSFACDGTKKRITDMVSWRRAQELARRVVTRNDWWNRDIGSSTHYHATDIRPYWAHTMKKMERIGHHIFYKTYGGGWI